MTKVDPIIAVKDVEASSKWYQLLFGCRSMHGGKEFDILVSEGDEVLICLQILTECELLEQEQSGREIYYHLNPKKIKEIADFLEPFRKFWDDRFNKLETVMKKYRSKK